MNYGDDYEPTEFEYEIITEPFWQEMQKIITKEVDGRTKGLIIQHERIKRQLEAEQTAHRLAKILANKAEADNKAGIEQVKKQAELDVQHQITGGYHIGQILWRSDQKTKRSRCQQCDCSGKVEAVYQDTIIKATCPKCKGHAEINHYWYEPEEMEIVNISIQKSKMVLCSSAYVRATICTDYDNDVPAKEAFITKEECEADCERLNAIERAKNK